MLKPEVNITVRRRQMMKLVRDTHCEPGLRMVRGTCTPITRDKIKCMLCMYETIPTWGPNTILHIIKNRLHCKSIFFRENFPMNIFIFCQKHCCSETSSEKHEEHYFTALSNKLRLRRVETDGAWKQNCQRCRLGMIRNSVVYV